MSVAKSTSGTCAKLIGMTAVYRKGKKGFSTSQSTVTAETEDGRTFTFKWYKLYRNGDQHRLASLVRKGFRYQHIEEGYIHYSFPKPSWDKGTFQGLANMFNCGELMPLIVYFKSDRSFKNARFESTNLIESASITMEVQMDIYKRRHGGPTCMQESIGWTYTRSNITHVHKSIKEFSTARTQKAIDDEERFR